MNRFDVYRLKKSQQKVIILQSDLHQNVIKSTVIAPLIDTKIYSGPILNQLMPSVLFDNQSFYILVQQLVPISNKDFGERLTSLNHYHHEITDAIDFLFKGF